MSRTLPLGFDATERAAALAPAVSLGWSARYLGRPVLSASTSADDGLGASFTSLAVLSSELLIFKRNGTAVQFGKRNATTLAVTAAFVSLQSGMAISEYPVGLTLSGGDILAIWSRTTTTVRWRI